MILSIGLYFAINHFLLILGIKYYVISFLLQIGDFVSRTCQFLIERYYPIYLQIRLTMLTSSSPPFYVPCRFSREGLKFQTRRSISKIRFKNYNFAQFILCFLKKLIFALTKWLINILIWSPLRVNDRLRERSSYDKFLFILFPAFTINFELLAIQEISRF